MITNAVCLQFIYHIPQNRYHWKSMLMPRWCTGPRRNSRHSSSVPHSHPCKVATEARPWKRHIRWNRDAGLWWEEVLCHGHYTTQESWSATVWLWEIDQVHVLRFHHVAGAVPLVCLSFQSVSNHETECYNAGAAKSLHGPTDLCTYW